MNDTTAGAPSRLVLRERVWALLVAILLLGLVVRIGLTVANGLLELSATPVLNSLLGIAHGAVGAWILSRSRSPVALFVAGWTAGQLIHWGAGPELLPEPYSTPAWIAYFVVAMLGESLLLHAAGLIFSRRDRLRPAARTAIYALPVAALLVAIAWRSTLLDQGLAETSQQIFFLLHALQVNIAPLATYTLLGLALRNAVQPSARRRLLGRAFFVGLGGLLPYVVFSVLEALGVGTPFGLSSDLTVAFFAVSAVALGTAVVGLDEARADDG